jgi:coenzyme F420-reducing hydrogenase delta subunit
MKEILTPAEKRLEQIVLEHSRLALEHIRIYNIEGSEKRCQEIKQRIEELRKERKKILK